MNYQTKGILVLATSSLVTGSLVAWLVPEKVAGALAGSSIGALAGAIAINRQQEDRLRKLISNDISSLKRDERLAQLALQYVDISQSVNALSAQVNLLKHKPDVIKALQQEIEALKAEGGAISTVPLVKETPTKTSSVGAISIDEDEGHEFTNTYEWFQSRQVEIQGYHQPEPALDDVLDDLAVYLGDNYNVLERFYKKLKSSLGKGCPFQLQEKSQKDVSIHTILLKKLKDSSLLSKGFYNKSDKIIVATTQNKEDVKFFLDGGWFERFVYDKIIDLLDAKGADYQVLRNLDITYNNGDHFELDIFFMIQGQPLLIECKAGKQFDSGIETFAKHRRRLSLNSENAIFVALELEERLTAVRTIRMGVTVANKDTFLSHVEKLLIARGIGQNVDEPEVDSSVATAANTVDINADTAEALSLSEVFNKRKINLAPEYRKVVLGELIQIFQQQDIALNFTQLIREVKDKLQDTPHELSRNKITEVLHTLRRSCLFSQERK